MRVRNRPLWTRVDSRPWRQRWLPRCPEIRAFVAQALNADPALALTAIQLRRERIESPDLDGLLNFTLYLELGA
ncbi:MAG: hypothetical protein H6R08_1530 [Proteobacteria bacterium]|nr:hypothetical protein [Pseudomonadota bacterium]